MRFSERMGLKPVRTELQLESMDDALRNGLWDVLYDHCLHRLNRKESVDWTQAPFLRRLWHDFFKEPTDTIPTWRESVYEILRSRHFAFDWDEVYDFIEVVVESYPLRGERLDRFAKECNSVMKRELSAYRLVGDEVVQITDELEIEAIEEALRSTSPFAGVREHLQTALGMLSDRESPDYRNSIKESISAVEGMARLITGHRKATLGQALKRLKDHGVEIHQAQGDAWSKLYGWTSDADGIRHAMMDLPELRFADAKYMLVSCCAFVNYLIEKAQEAKIQLRALK